MSPCLCNDQTQGSGAVFSLLYRIPLLNSEQSLPLEIPTRLQKPCFGRRNHLGAKFNTLGQHFWNKIWQVLVVPREIRQIFLKWNFKHQIWRLHHLELKQKGPKKKNKKKQRDKQTNKTNKKTNSRKAPQIGIKESWNPWKGSSV